MRLLPPWLVPEASRCRGLLPPLLPPLPKPAAARSRSSSSGAEPGRLKLDDAERGCRDVSVGLLSAVELARALPRVEGLTAASSMADEPSDDAFELPRRRRTALLSFCHMRLGTVGGAHTTQQTSAQR